jgi:hypothetical protein
LSEDHILRADQESRAAALGPDGETQLREAIAALLALAESLDVLELDGVAPAFTPSGWPP